MRKPDISSKSVGDMRGRNSKDRSTSNLLAPGSPPTNRTARSTWAGRFFLVVTKGRSTYIIVFLADFFFFFFAPFFFVPFLAPFFAPFLADFFLATLRPPNKVGGGPENRWLPRSRFEKRLGPTRNKKSDFHFLSNFADEPFIRQASSSNVRSSNGTHVEYLYAFPKILQHVFGPIPKNRNKNSPTASSANQSACASNRG